MKTLFKQGASQGDGPREAYFVNVRVVETIAREDIRDGSVNVVLGLAPLEPAEFVVIRIARIARQARALGERFDPC